MLCRLSHSVEYPLSLIPLVLWCLLIHICCTRASLEATQLGSSSSVSLLTGDISSSCGVSFDSFCSSFASLLPTNSVTVNVATLGNFDFILPYSMSSY